MVMLPVDAMMTVMCHVLFVCCMAQDDNATIACSPAVLTQSCRCPVLWIVSQYELHADELALWHFSLR